MAKKLSPAQAQARGVSREELLRVVKEHDRQSAHASEYAGHAGQVIKTAVDKHNLNVKALRAAIGANKMEPSKRQDYLRSFIDYAFKLGFFDDIDAFDDILTDFQTIIDEVRARSEKGESGGKADPIVAATLQ